MAQNALEASIEMLKNQTLGDHINAN